ncbi:hypothetical protein PanWU01x14_164640 [Parasponia andersonii]|uniref:Uncharacterized protein n=1 Tax=Parasponia andersonii TaxID=3476 RepID=A0A2P5CCH1_PARAD|nr:hypothetical protein PanWU01x14_164640 [Parasponia andersonii]
MENNNWEWFGSGFAKAFIVDRSIKVLDLVNKIYNRVHIDQSVYSIKITHKVAGDIYNETTPNHIYGDSDIKDLMNFYRHDHAITLHIILEENQDNRKVVFVNDDGDGNEFNNDNIELEFEGYSNNDYFGCHIMEQVSNSARFVRNGVFDEYEYPLQTCTISMENHKGITSPTPEKIVYEDELEGGDKVIEDKKINQIIKGSLVCQ